MMKVSQNFLMVLGMLMIPSLSAFAQISAEKMDQLRAKRELARSWAPLCADGTQSHGHCPFGDMAIFSGMLCLSGETERCNGVKHAQGPDGRWWRSPELVGNDNEVNTFSRDQAKGALAYLVATKDVAAALSWQGYLEAHDKKMCPTTTDNRCTITSGTGQLFGAVWEYLGLKPARWMKKSLWYSNVYDQFEAKFQPTGFPMHLNALNAWIRLEIERRGGPKADSVDQKVLKILVQREPTNPYFLLLRNGPTEEVANLILEKCPDQKPKDELLDWSWQRDQSHQVWLHASGHDCIYIVNVFEKELSLLSNRN